MLQITHQDLTSLNTLGLRAHASAFVRYDSHAHLSELSDMAAGYPGVFILGGGSNVVLAPALDCLVIKVVSRGIAIFDETDREVIIEAHAGEIWHDFVATCLAHGWNGLENLALIPGTVGAAPVQNIGAYGVELDQRFHSLVVWDMATKQTLEMSAADCQFSYRNSFFKHAEPGRWLIVKVRFSLQRYWKPVLDYPDLQRHPVIQAAGASVTASQIFDAVCEIRRNKLPDPSVMGNAGSFFKNPLVSAEVFDDMKSRFPGLVAYLQADGQYKLAAGWLIDHAGWKGRRLGSVGVHDRQALVLVNHGGATAQDIESLADAIRVDVAGQFGVRLDQEPVIIDGRIRRA